MNLTQRLILSAHAQRTRAASSHRGDRWVGIGSLIIALILLSGVVA